MGPFIGVDSFGFLDAVSVPRNDTGRSRRRGIGAVAAKTGRLPRKNQQRGQNTTAAAEKNPR